LPGRRGPEISYRKNQQALDHPSENEHGPYGPIHGVSSINRWNDDEISMPLSAL
jgi:hypothetical protein